MRAGIDIQTLETAERDRGLGRLCLGTIQALHRHAPDIALTLFGMGAEPPACLGGVLERAEYARIDLGERAAGTGHDGLALLQQAVARHRLNLYHVTSALMPDIVIPADPPCAAVATIADAIPAAARADGKPLYTGAAADAYRRRVGVLGTYDGFLAISESAAEDADRFLGIRRNRTTVTHVAMDLEPPPDPSRDRSVLERHGLPAGGVVCVSGDNPRKNLEGTLQAYAMLPRAMREKHALVLVCALTDATRERLMEEAARLGISGTFRVTGFVEDHADVLRIVRQSRVMLFPSMYEGFGIPVVEALSVGVPVVAADNSSLPEVTGDAGLLAPADDARALAAALERILGSEAEWSRLAARAPAQAGRFSLERHAELVRAGYEQALASFAGRFGDGVVAIGDSARHTRPARVALARQSAVHLTDGSYKNLGRAWADSDTSSEPAPAVRGLPLAVLAGASAATIHHGPLHTLAVEATAGCGPPPVLAPRRPRAGMEPCGRAEARRHLGIGSSEFVVGYPVVVQAAGMINALSQVCRALCEDGVAATVVACGRFSRTQVRQFDFAASAQGVRHLVRLVPEGEWGVVMAAADVVLHMGGAGFDYAERCAMDAAVVGLPIVTTTDTDLFAAAPAGKVMSLAADSPDYAELQEAIRRLACDPALRASLGAAARLWAGTLAAGHAAAGSESMRRSR